MSLYRIGSSLLRLPGGGGVWRPPDAATGLTWPQHSPAYLPVIPGLSGYGMDTAGGTGRHLTPGNEATRIFLIDSLEDANSGSARPELGTNIYSGTFEYCWRAVTDPALLGKIMMPIISGWCPTNNSIPGMQGTAPVGSNATFWGHVAPLPGFFLRGTRPVINGTSHFVVMGMRSYMGDEAGLSGDSRDCFGAGYGGGTTTHIVLIGNEFAWSVDEIVDFLRPCSVVSWVYNAFINPLHVSDVLHPGDPPGTDHGFGPLNGGDTTQPGTFSCFRNVFAHGTGRNPATTATGFCHANNWHYNHGRPAVGAGEAVDIWSQFTTEAMLANVLWNVFQRGPNNNSSLIGVRTRSGAPAGTEGFMSGNMQLGWSAASQADMLNDGIGTWLQGSLRSGAIPSSWGGEAGVLQWAVDPYNPTADEVAAIIALMEASTGAQPNARSTTYGKVQKAWDQIRARSLGGSTSNQFINTISDDGDFTVPEVLIDPTDPGDTWYEPPPFGAGRDTPYAFGTFRNGLSREGRSPLEVWAIEEYWRRGGK